MTKILLGRVVFVVLVLALSALVLRAGTILLPSGPLPTEAAILSRAELASGLRLACQTRLRADLSITLPDSVLSARSWNCTVVSSRTIAPIIREIVLAPSGDAPFSFTPGAFLTIEAPAYALNFADYEIAPEHRAAWDRQGLGALRARGGGGISRAYSIANRAVEDAGRIVLLVRLALPPPDRPEAAPGIVSSWLFGLCAGEGLRLAGPFGSFAAQDSAREMVFIGGGVGMAPLRAIIPDQLERGKTTRKMSLWYGARSRVDLFYEAEFERLQATYPNFRWTAPLSDPAPGDDWQGETGFIHEVALRGGLASHPAPHDCEYYLCGPPMMIKAVLAMLDDLGVGRDRIFNDDFGG
ncbi:NADH-quinone reductase [Defluviimonas sp. 20V17]|uniref:Na(+)-translocating NADH-quinone reductase subunit F n=1 Tax=Allgaiera indica TaxID=765699 RepID=A0AAN4UP37_9RHOB|nr:NADH:ubiquinone reductase (Na(+)-transporting) subunit F [Allgaiera indica]KDB04539.1 NADH-quinone reductase [Defluviimonas sp. 20V17]GHD99726.1 Na(+)-translocating NADH-quinone reductase subunit F [Allgaiera indica]SDW19688.1 Na+-transporting NADH:ubiquinone oxidoreductase subunit F [Allgaiera indica]